MDVVLEKALRKKTQKRIIKLLYQDGKKLNTSKLAEALQTSATSVSNITRKMRERGILEYRGEGRARYFSLTQIAIDYLVKYHPEIEPAEIITDLNDSNPKEFETTNQIIESEENVPKVNNITDMNPELREYYIKAIELLKLPNYMNLLMNYSLREAILLSFLIICYLENKKFNSSDIAMLFGISETEVSSVYRKTLLMLKDRLNEFIDDLLNYTPEAIQPDNNTILNVKNTSY